MNTELLPRSGVILCAVSGGADSVYLLFRLRELGYAAAAAHYHHGLRGENADRDEAFVHELCRAHDIPLVSERGDAAAYARERRLGIEEAARELRYAFLERAADAMSASVIATAHTADDNAETILMRLIRGAGLRGLGGIPPVRGRIVRPLLDETHDEALAYLSARGIPHVEDETNAGDVYFRNRLRHAVMPRLRAENPSFSRTVSRTAALLREDEAFLAGLAEDFLRRNSDGSSLPAAELAALPRPIALRAVRLMADGISAEQAGSVLALAQSGGYTDVSGMRVGVSGGRVIFGVPSCDVLPTAALEPGRKLALPGTGLTILCEKIPVFPADVYKSLNTFYLKCENICGSIIVTARRPGDKYRPAGRGCSKSIKQLFLEAGVPRWERGSVPVLRDGSGILGVYGFGPAERACARPGDRDVIRIQFLREDAQCTTI